MSKDEKNLIDNDFPFQPQVEEEEKVEEQKAEGESPPSEKGKEKIPINFQSEEFENIKSEISNLKKALEEERSRRQEALRMLEYYQFLAKAKPQENIQQPKKEEPPEIEALKPLVQPIIQETISPLESETRITKATLSEERARAKYKDYDELVYSNIKTPDGKEMPFLNFVVSDPTLSQLFYNSPDPAEFAYKMAMFLNFEKFLDKAREEGRQEIIKKLEKSSKAPSPLATKSTGSPSTKHGEISLDEAINLSFEEWAQLPEKTRKKLLELA